MAESVGRSSEGKRRRAGGAGSPGEAVEGQNDTHWNMGLRSRPQVIDTAMRVQHGMQCANRDARTVSYTCSTTQKYIMLHVGKLLCGTPSSLHCTLKVSEHDSLWQPPVTYSNKCPRPQKSSRAQHRLNSNSRLSRGHGCTR